MLLPWINDNFFVYLLYTSKIGLNGVECVLWSPICLVCCRLVHMDPIQHIIRRLLARCCRSVGSSGNRLGHSRRYTNTAVFFDCSWNSQNRLGASPTVFNVARICSKHTVHVGAKHLRMRQS